MIVEAPKKLHTHFRYTKTFLIYTCFDIVTMSSSVESEKNSFKNCFKIIDSDKSYIKLKIKEGFHITREKPELNVQVKHFKSSFI